MSPVLLDTGPLVALVVGTDARHGWAIDQLKSMAPPLITCEAVIAEACFLLKREKLDPTEVIRLARAGLFEVRFDFGREAAVLQELMTRYRDQPMSFADACLVRLAELHPQSSVWTLDRDFKIYRRNRRSSIPLISPFD
ncbi:MAG: PIN domain-containing protein [Opitutaceae bacterium]|nr:PIN domain-containing protein [Opitutaceae bacterium]